MDSLLALRHDSALVDSAYPAVTIGSLIGLVIGVAVVYLMIHVFADVCSDIENRDHRSHLSDD